VPPWPKVIDPTFGLNQPENYPALAPQNALQLASGMGGVVVMNHFRAVP
jgi:hypothetical protein